MSISYLIQSILFISSPHRSKAYGDGQNKKKMSSHLFVHTVLLCKYSMINITVQKSFQTLTTKSLTLIQLKTIHRKETSLSLRNSTVNLEVGTSLRLTLFSPSEVTNHANLTEIGWPTLLPKTHPLSNNQMCFNRNTRPALFTTSCYGSRFFCAGPLVLFKPGK